MSPKVAKSFGDVLLGLREKKGWNQAETARETGIDQSSISRWEAGKGEPGAESLKALSLGFGISIDAMLGFEPPEFAPPRKPTDEEIALVMLERFGIRGRRLDMVRFALLGEDIDIKIVHAHIPALDLAAAAREKRKGSSGA